MTAVTDTKRIRDLCELLGQLARLHEELGEIVESKTTSMRRADVVSLQVTSRQERLVVERIAEREGLRRQLMDAVGRSWGMKSRAARSMTASELIARTPAHQRTAIETATSLLRDAVSKVARVNRVAGTVASELVNHLQWIWSAVRPTGDERVGYTPTGSHAAMGNDRILEATG